jgi:kinetochore protein Spc7/SPC105
MTYRREIELVFEASAFQTTPEQKGKRGRKSTNNSSNAPAIDLWYIAATREHDPRPLTPEKEFYLECIRDHLRAQQPHTTTVSRMLGVVRATWDQANQVAHHVRLLNISFPTAVVKTSDSSVAVRSTMLLVPLQTKVEVAIDLKHSSSAVGVDVAVQASATIVYGEQFKPDMMAKFLETRLGGSTVSQQIDGKGIDWSTVVLELHRKLLKARK